MSTDVPRLIGTKPMSKRNEGRSRGEDLDPTEKPTRNGNTKNASMSGKIHPQTMKHNQKSPTIPAEQ
jgi:hypothetical protein